ncbi:hypothetical protein AZE42_03742 [Rhizopogon vesiculosus]|uniref:Tetratricopeptide repeat protein n=1 Tax=Rhizopogon vesiculosus TaxID=180088 RepID=A0A1J8QEI2_9AGAM|nr:hypothetical protein AZE42_03742 [Rhizopogon vesiculosus]
MSDEALIASCRGWSIAFKQALYAASGDAALAAKDYDRAIELYSAAIGLDSTTDTIFVSRCTAKLGKMEWDDALVDAQRVR